MESQSLRVIIELLDSDGNPISALNDTEITLNSTMGKIAEPSTKIPKGKDKGQSILVSSKRAGAVILSADAKGLKGTEYYSDLQGKETLLYALWVYNIFSGEAMPGM